VKTNPIFNQMTEDGRRMTDDGRQPVRRSLGEVGKTDDGRQMPENRGQITEVYPPEAGQKTAKMGVIMEIIP